MTFLMPFFKRSGWFGNTEAIYFFNKYMKKADKSDDKQ